MHVDKKVNKIRVYTIDFITQSREEGGQLFPGTLKTRHNHRLHDSHDSTCEACEVWRGCEACEGREGDQVTSDQAKRVIRDIDIRERMRREWWYEWYGTAMEVGAKDALYSEWIKINNDSLWGTSGFRRLRNRFTKKRLVCKERSYLTCEEWE